MGDPLPYTARLEIDQPLKALTADYTDSCSQPVQFPVGTHMEEALIEGAKRTYRTVLYDTDRQDDPRPDLVIKIELLNWSFELDKDALYDRAPTLLQLNATARVHDASGSVLRETEIQVARRDRLRLEQLAKNCNYVIKPFVRETAVEMASKIFLDTRLALQGNYPIAAQQPSQAKDSDGRERTTAVVPSHLKFKAMLLDENSNLVLEGGEHVRVRVDVVNTGPSPVVAASASLTGTPSVLEQFPATTLQIPPLQPGETKSLEFVATMPPSTHLQQAEILVAVVETSGAAAPSQLLPLTIEPSGTGTDEVDQIPFSPSGFHRPNTFLVSIGVGAYRNTRIQPRRYAALDAKAVANYFRTVGGVPPANIRLLQDTTAFRYEIDEALQDWLPSVAGKDSVVVVYFSGQAVVNKTGEIFLISHEGSPSIQSLLYPFKEIKAVVSRLSAKHVLFLFDGKVLQFQGEGVAKPATPNWMISGTQTVAMISGEGLAKGLEDDQHRHGLFTYYLLRGLRGEADTNRDRAVTLGELGGYVRQKVAWAAKSQFGVEQRPQILPPLKPGDKTGGLVLSKLPTLTGGERPR